MTEERKNILRKNSIDIDSALARFAENEDIYLKYLHSFPKDGTYGSFMDSYKANKLWQAQNQVVALTELAGNLGLTSLYEAAHGLIGKLKNGSNGDTIAAVERLVNEYEAAMKLIENCRIQEGECNG